MKKILTLFVLLLMGFAPEGEKKVTETNPKSDVFLQGFYWNSTPGGIWWDSLAALAPQLASAGFGGVWIPSPAKGAGGANSMGYDIYDHYDFGDYFQKGSRETRFGSREELENMIEVFHSVGVEVFADAVMDHMIGGDEYAPYECGGDSGWVIFNYPNGSGKWKKDETFFYPHSGTCSQSQPYTDSYFGEALAHDRAFVRDSLVEWGNYLLHELNFDGFRLDAVKHIEPEYMADWLKRVNPGYAVGEFFGNTNEIKSWLSSVNNNGAGISMFDFDLRYTLQSMCNSSDGSFNMNSLDYTGLVNNGVWGPSVATFLENHDFDRIGWNDSIDVGHNPVYNDKDLGYAYMMFSEGRPSVFYKDYFEYGYKGKIDTLIWIRQNFLGGGTTKRSGLNPYYIREDGDQNQGFLSDDIYVARRDGYQSQPGGYIVINDNASQWIDVWVDTEYAEGTVLRDYTGTDADKIVVGPSQQGGKNRVKLWAPPRGYSLYVPDTTMTLNHPPVLKEVPDQVVYTGQSFEFDIEYNDANSDSELQFSLTGSPAWLSVDAGKLQGTPAFDDTTESEVVVTITDSQNASASDTFNIAVYYNTSPVLDTIPNLKVEAAKRFEYQSTFNDAQDDELTFSYAVAPQWLKIGEHTGLISGTPAIEDTGYYSVTLQASDGKGGIVSDSFFVEVVENLDTLIATYGKPVIDGTVHQNPDDWLNEWLVYADSDTDSYWNPKTPIPDNELYNIYATWDADSLYLGIDYILDDNFNTLMIYIDNGLAEGRTNFNSESGYVGDYAKNFRFPDTADIEYFVACYYDDDPVFFKVDSNYSIEMSDEFNGIRGSAGKDLEAAIAWDDLYGLGSGLVPNGIELKFVTLVAGGEDYGAGDSAPDNPDTDGDEGPDSLKNLITLKIDEDGDGIPDPTLLISSVKEYAIAGGIPQEYGLTQNYPNPFNPSTIIEYSIPAAGSVDLKVYDILGREVAVLVNGIKNAGTYRVTFDAGKLSSGIYFYRVTSGDYSDVKKMILLK